MAWMAPVVTWLGSLGSTAAASTTAATAATAAGTAGSAAVAAGSTLAVEAGGTGIVAGTGAAAGGVTLGQVAGAASLLGTGLSIANASKKIPLPPNPTMGQMGIDQSAQAAGQAAQRRESISGGLNSTIGTSGGAAGMLNPSTLGQKTLLGQ